MREDLLAEAMAGFWSALGVVDPMRIEAWDNQGLTIGQLRLMSMLLFDESKTMSELTDSLDVRMPTVTGLIDRLVRQGMIERYDDQEDRRVVRVGLSQQGRLTMRQMENNAREFIAPVLERLGPPKVRKLIEVFDEFVEAAREIRQEARASGVRR